MNTSSATSAAATAARAVAIQSAPRFEIDPWWPKPLPEGWITGQLACVYVDHHDHVLIVNRGDITEEEKETCIRAPAVMIFDLAGNMIGSWGDWDVLPSTPHSCAVDKENNVWITANGDGMVQKYTYDGKLLLQIGKKGVFDTEDGAKKSRNLNAGQNRLNKPAGVACDPENGDVYFADGYGNRRVVVFDRNGKFLRQWGRQATKEEMEAGVGGAFAEGRSRAGVRQDGQLQEKRLGEDRDFNAAGKTRHGMVDGIFSGSGTEAPICNERAQRAGPYPRSCERDHCFELRPSRASTG
jgi:hypothetical protein